MNLIDNVNVWLENRWNGLAFLDRKKSSFHARDASVVFRSGFTKEEVFLREKYNLTQVKVEGKCLRAIYYDFLGKKTTNVIEATSQRVMDIGSAVEAQEADYLRDMGILQSQHVRLFNAEYQISGEVDCLIWEHDVIADVEGLEPAIAVIREPRVLVGLEIKSFYGYYAEKEIMHGFRAKWNHILQALIYLEHYYPEIPYWLLTYISRGGGVHCGDEGYLNGRQFKLTMDKKGTVSINGTEVKEFKMVNVYDRFKKARFHNENNILPERDYVYKYPDELVELRYVQGDITKSAYTKYHKEGKYISDWQCNYCPYLVECWKDVHGDKVRGASEIEETV